MGSRAHTSRAWEYGRNMLKKGEEYRRLGDIAIREWLIAIHVGPTGGPVQRPKRTEGNEAPRRGRSGPKATRLRIEAQAG